MRRYATHGVHVERPIQCIPVRTSNLGKPVIAINTATYWHALRAQGITDKVAGLGNLLECH